MNEEHDARQNWRGVYLATLATLIAVESILLWRGTSLVTPLVFLILTIVFVRGRERLSFALDFAPFLLVLFVYYSMWGSADDLGGAVTVMPQIAAEKALFFGHVPTIELQRALYDPEHAHWYDYAAVGLHVTHFLLPALFAAVLWRHYRGMHVRFMTAFVLLSYAGYLTFVLMPTAPPWLASQMGALDTVYLVQKHVPFFQRLFEGASANPVAAWPSLHAAVPWLMFLFALRVWGRKAVPMAFYPLAIWVNIVYLGHHYVVDAIGGVAYASAAFAVVELAPWRLLRERLVILMPWRPSLRGGLQTLARKPRTQVLREASAMAREHPGEAEAA